MGAEAALKDVFSDEENQFVTFMLGDEEYAIEALRVQEITGLPPITKVPYLPSFVKGVINLRGSVIPVIDLRLRFGLAEAEYSKQTCVIVLKLGKKVTGIIVDAVSEVASLPNARMDPPPDFGKSIKTDFLKGIGKLSDRMLILLDAEKIFTVEEIAGLELAAQV